MYEEMRQRDMHVANTMKCNHKHIRSITQYLHFNHNLPGDCLFKKIKNLINNYSNGSSYQCFLDPEQINHVSFFLNFETTVFLIM